MPVVGFNDSGGARIQEGIDSLCGYGKIFFRNTRASGVIPQIVGDPGALRRRRGLLPGHDRLGVHGEQVQLMYITGPDVVKAVMGEEISHEELGGARCTTGRAAWPTSC